MLKLTGNTTPAKPCEGRFGYILFVCDLMGMSLCCDKFTNKQSFCNPALPLQLCEQYRQLSVASPVLDFPLTSNLLNTEVSPLNSKCLHVA